MFSKPRQLESETELYEAAVRALMRRAYSVYEMKQLLGRRTEDDNLLRTVMDRLKRAKMIDDERFAKQFARQRTEIRRQGKFRIARDLRARGVPDRHIEAALAESAKETDESAVVRQRGVWNLVLPPSRIIARVYLAVAVEEGGLWHQPDRQVASGRPAEIRSAQERL